VEGATQAPLNRKGGKLNVQKEKTCEEKAPQEE